MFTSQFLDLRNYLTLIFIILKAWWDLGGRCHHFFGDAMNLTPMIVTIQGVSKSFVANVTSGLDLWEVFNPKVSFCSAAVTTFEATGHTDMHVAVF